MNTPNSYQGGYSITHNEFAISKILLLQQYKIADNECVMSYRITPQVIYVFIRTFRPILVVHMRQKQAAWYDCTT
jgi:hypothetical protein